MYDIGGHGEGVTDSTTDDTTDGITDGNTDSNTDGTTDGDSAGSVDQVRFSVSYTHLTLPTILRV